MTLPLKIQDRRFCDAVQLESAIADSGFIHDNVFIMRGALAQHFPLTELQSISLSDLCDLYVQLIKESR